MPEAAPYRGRGSSTHTVRQLMDSPSNPRLRSPLKQNRMARCGDQPGNDRNVDRSPTHQCPRRRRAADRASVIQGAGTNTRETDGRPRRCTAPLSSQQRLNGIRRGEPRRTQSCTGFPIGTTRWWCFGPARRHRGPTRISSRFMQVPSGIHKPASVNFLTRDVG